MKKQIERKENIQRMINKLTEALDNEKIEVFAVINEDCGDTIAQHVTEACRGETLINAYNHLIEEHPVLPMLAAASRECDCAKCPETDCQARKEPYNA